MPLRLRVDGKVFRDGHNREVTLHGINVAGDAKYPRSPDQCGHIKENFFEGDHVSFVGRPFNLDEAHTHFDRLKRWGYNTIRYIYTWEAIEHAGPGKYDEEWIQHTIEVLRLAKEYGFYVFMDPHQDVWSRFTGGSGAPMWTIYACGLNPQAFLSTQAALVQNTWPNPAEFPKMIWATNYQRLACQTILTLFFAGKEFAPKAVLDGINIQDYLQGHFLGAMKILAQRIKEAGDLESDVVIGWESMNEPNKGYIGWEDLSKWPADQNLKKGPTPTAFQSMLTGLGRAVEQDTFEFGNFGPYKSGSELIDPKGEIAWLPADYDDSRYGWKRDPGWKLGECLWAQHGVWDPKNDKLLKNDYFLRVPVSGEKITHEYYTNNFWLNHYRAYRDTIRAIFPNTIMFCQSSPFEVPPSIKGTKDDDPQMVFAPHFYDGITLITKKWNRFWNVDVVGIMRGKYLSPAFAVKLGESAIRNCFRDQLKYLREEGEEKMGVHPTVFTEIGIPYDMDDKYAYKTGNFTSQTLAMDANHFALEGSGVAGFTLWTYVPSNSHYWGDNWNGEDLSIYSVDDKQLPSSPEVDSSTYNPESPSYSEDRMSASKTPSINSDGVGMRAAEAYVRPTQTATHGRVVSHGFDLKNCVFQLTLSAPSATSEDAPTEVFLPEFHFPQGKTEVEVLGGKWKISVDETQGATQQVLRWWHAAGEQKLTVRALEATYDARSTNDTRRAALEFLDGAKKQADAPQHGYSLASDSSQQPAIRHFGLSLLEYALRYKWEDYDQNQAETLRSWILNLAQDVSESDPQYFRNKVASLWVEVAKRCWGAEWLDMDALLMTLWETQDDSKQLVYRQMVLYILECLSEDICNKEDPVAGLRQDVLGQSLNEIVIPTQLYKDHLVARGSSQNVRHTQDGWLSRMCAFLFQCSTFISQGDQRVVMSATKTLEALRPTVTWLSLRALTETQCVESLYKMLAAGDAKVQTATIDVLQAILSRPYNPHFHESWSEIMLSVLQPDHIELLKNLHLSCNSSADDIDEAKYTLQKKLSEVLSVLGDAAASNPEILATLDNCTALIDVMMIAFQHDSLLVSIPVLHSFTKLLVAKSPTISTIMRQKVAILLGTCSQRLIKYESLTDEELPVILYLNEDFENPPELHSFLGNYRRYCITVIESIAFYMPQEAVGHILDQTVQMIDTICQEFRPPFPTLGPAKTPIPVLQLESQASVLRSTMNGFITWYGNASRPESKSEEHTTNNVYGVTLTSLRDFCYKLMTMKPQHPEIARLTTHIAVNVLVKTLQGQPELVVKILDYCLSLQYPDDGSNKEYSAAVKGFQGARLGEMQRIAMSFPDYLLDVYSDLEARVNALMSAEGADERTKWGLQSFLFIVVHRASAVDSQARIARLQQIIRPVIETWQDPQLTEALSTFSGFCNVVGLAGLPEYLSNQRYASVQDWPSQPLDQEGKARQIDVQMKVMRLPLNATKNLLAATTEKLKESSREYQIATQVWGPAMQAMLSNVLQMTRHATSFPNSSNWANFPPELQMVMQKMLVDRFWQAGISNESRDEFYARIAESGDTYEGFASAIRGIPRQIRDWCYHIIYGMTRFEEEFFGLQELPGPLAEALLTDASSLSTHHLQRLIALVERLVQRCPAHHRKHFMPPILSLFFSQTDKKISAEWEIIERSSTQSVEGEDQLSDEMKAESVLRATTYAVVSFASTLLDQRATDVTSTSQPQTSHHTMRTLILSSPSILEPLILFCTHTLRMRDSRCCTLITRILRSILPSFTSSDPPSPQVREFISTEVLKACITSLNEPYFVDVQRDLANLIANIVALYSGLSSTARDVLLSLPDMGAGKVDQAIERIVASNSERTQRILVLELLEGVRGVSIHEQGKIDRRDVRSKRSAMQQQYMEVEQKTAGKREQSPKLEGMAEMFGGE
ncbi:hypothetical protein E4T39_07845 [Aureobasidium subglaciale]|nr:hypothetical protein E4T39_07845 [Aureobasidium subglaciale]